MYLVSIKGVSGEEKFEADDFFSNKRDVVRFIARVVGEKQSAIADEINTKTDSILYRDSRGWRAQVWYT